MRNFIEQILQEKYKENASYVFNNSPLIRYLDFKMGAVSWNSKTRRSYGNLYAIYSILYFYIENNFYTNRIEYIKFTGFDYGKLFEFCRAQYGGSKIQNHALNNRLNAEFINITNKKNKSTVTNELLIIYGTKYLIHVDYLYVNEIDISKTLLQIIETYISLLKAKDLKLSNDLEDLMTNKRTTYKKKKIDALLKEKSEARIFEIISYAILKNHYKNCFMYIAQLELVLKKNILNYTKLEELMLMMGA